MCGQRQPGTVRVWRWRVLASRGRIAWTRHRCMVSGSLLIRASAPANSGVAAPLAGAARMTPREDALNRHKGLARNGRVVHR